MHHAWCKLKNKILFIYNGEKIPQEEVIHFSELANNENKNWRRKLSNQHISPFLLKGNNWNKY